MKNKNEYIKILIYNCWDDALGHTGSSVLWLVGKNLGSKPQSLHYCQGYIFRGAGETNGGYALLMMAKPPKAALYRAHTFFFSLHHMLACSSFLSSFFTHKFEVCSHV